MKTENEKQIKEVGGDTTGSFGTPYDDATRTMLTDSPLLAVSLVNEMFGLHLSCGTGVTAFQNEVFIAGNRKRVTDASLAFDGDERRFHIESESSPGDSYILLRIFEYDSAIARVSGNLDDDTLHVRYPKTGILFLRSNEKTPDEMWMEIETPDADDHIRIKVSVMKVRDYTLEEIFEKKLWFLLPFHVFLYSKELDKETVDSDTEQAVIRAYEIIKNRLDGLSKSGQIDSFSKRLLELMCDKVVCALARKSSVITERMGDIMGGQVLDYDAKRILNQGIDIGEARGEKTGAEENRRQAVIRMLELGRSSEAISEFTGEDLVYVQQIEKSLIEGR